MYNNLHSYLFSRRKILLYEFSENNDKKHDKSHYQNVNITFKLTNFVHALLKSFKMFL